MNYSGILKKVVYETEDGKVFYLEGFDAERFNSQLATIRAYWLQNDHTLDELNWKKAEQDGLLKIYVKGNLLTQGDTVIYKNKRYYILGIADDVLALQPFSSKISFNAILARAEDVLEVKLKERIWHLQIAKVSKEWQSEKVDKK